MSIGNIDSAYMSAEQERTIPSNLKDSTYLFPWLRRENGMRGVQVFELWS